MIHRVACRAEIFLDADRRDACAAAASMCGKALRPARQRYAGRLAASHRSVANLD